MVKYLFVAVTAQALSPPPPPPPPPTCDPFLLFFDAGSATVSAKAHRTIDNIVSVEDHMKPHMIVIGYTDAPGSKSYNLELSRLRAETVKAALMAKGVPASMIIVGAGGEAQPLVKTDDAEAENRRVQVSTC